MKNAISIDLEDWFCVHNLSGVIKAAEWDKYELRVRESTERLLTLFRKHHTRATFFVLGWIAERLPELICEVEEQGHEIAVHGYSHLLLTEITPEEFDLDLQRALEAIDKAGVKSRPRGFRAPSFTVVEATKPWALPILEKHGIKYDSSIFPIGFHPDYGMTDSPLRPYRITENLYEFPMSVLEFWGRRLPFCGGGYFRILPYTYTKYCMRKLNQQGHPAVFYLHPWELDVDQPRIHELSRSKKFRHYRNIDQTEKRLNRLLTDFEFTTMSEVLGLE